MQATVACHQLNPMYTSGTHCNAELLDYQCATDGVSSLCTSYALDNVQCDGTEADLTHCTGVGRGHTDCSKTEAVFLVCSSQGPATCPPPPPVQIRLMNPATGQPSATVGVLQAMVGNSGTWGPVCDDYFDQNANAVEVRASLHYLPPRPPPPPS